MRAIIFILVNINQQEYKYTSYYTHSNANNAIKRFIDKVF